MNLRGRNLAPFDLEQGWLMILGADSLGRPILARIDRRRAQNTITIAFFAVLAAATIGGVPRAGRRATRGRSSRT